VRPMIGDKSHSLLLVPGCLRVEKSTTLNLSPKSAPLKAASQRHEILTEVWPFARYRSQPNDSERTDEKIKRAASTDGWRLER
jgi:hypothetical protein